MLYRLDQKTPEIHNSAFIAEDSSIIGDVTIGQLSGIWFQAVLRADGQPIKIGSYSNIQDSSVIHITTRGSGVLIGDRVSVGHKAIVHAATLENSSFVGMAATVMDNVVVRPYGLVAAGALVTAGMEVPEKTLVAGVPAKIIRPLKQAEVDMIEKTADLYSQKAEQFNQHCARIDG